MRKEGRKEGKKGLSSTSRRSGWRNGEMEKWVERVLMDKEQKMKERKEIQSFSILNR